MSKRCRIDDDDFKLPNTYEELCNKNGGIKKKYGLEVHPDSMKNFDCKDKATQKWQELQNKCANNIDDLGLIDTEMFERFLDENKTVQKSIYIITKC